MDSRVTTHKLRLLKLPHCIYSECVIALLTSQSRFLTAIVILLNRAERASQTVKVVKIGLFKHNFHTEMNLPFAIRHFCAFL